MGCDDDINPMKTRNFVQTNGLHVLVVFWIRLVQRMAEVNQGLAFDVAGSEEMVTGDRNFKT